MKVAIDDSKCQGYGNCATHIPDVVKLDQWGYAYVDDGEVPEGDEELAHRAVLDCPMHAVTMVSD